MRTIRFTKAEGAQNDFVIVGGSENDLNTRERSQFSQQVCHRRKGVGADGTIFIVPSETHDFTMEFYNPDGSFGSMCGNGGRCAALYAQRKGIAGTVMRFETLGKSYRAEVRGNDVKLFFPPPEIIESPLCLQFGDQQLAGHFVDTGAPHLVILLDENVAVLPGALDDLDVQGIGRALRMHQRFQPAGTNVNFIGASPSGEIHIRTFEKGVETETEACGTGNLASALVLNLIRKLAPPIRLRTHGGDILSAGFDLPETPYSGNPSAYFSKGLFLAGPAHLVFEGEIVL
jgi:diaminopimelate epimerase